MSGRNLRLKDGSIQLTHCDGHDTALLTVRGKDHDLDAGELRTLARACQAAAGPSATLTPLSPTDISAPMMIALAGLLTDPCPLSDEDRWVNANTRRALVRRHLAKVEDKILSITPTGRLVVSAYLLGAEQARARRTEQWWS